MAHHAYCPKAVIEHSQLQGSIDSDVLQIAPDVALVISIKQLCPYVAA